MSRSQDHLFAFGIGDSAIVSAISKVTARDTNGAPISGHLVGNLREKPTAQREQLADKGVRRLIIEMHTVFDRCRHIARSRGKLDADETLQVSREYRAVLLAAADRSDSGDRFLRDFTLWSLFETMFLKAGDSPICLDLMTWAMETFTFVEETTNLAVVEHSQGVPVNEGNFWRAAAQQLISLRFDTCSEMLDILRNDQAAITFQEHLDLLDVSWLSDETKISRFESWQKNLQSACSSGQFDSNRNILFLARLVLGEDRTLSRVAEVVVSEWFHLMPLFVFARYATASYTEIGSAAEECRALFEKPGIELPSAEDDPFLATFNLGDVAVLQNLMPNPWLSLHLVDTMFHSDGFDQPVYRIRNALLMDYGASLLVNSNLWEMGADYLLECDVEGKLRLESHIAALHIEDDAMAEKLLSLCVEHELEESRTCIINTMTNRHLRKSNWATALSWALRGGRSKTLDAAVNRIVWHASQTEIASLYMLEHLDQLLLLSPSLSFLFQYHRFYTAALKGNVHAATKTLIPLVMAPDVPSSFPKVLFGHLRIILGQMKQVEIPRDTIYQLLSFFKQYTIENQKQWNVEEREQMDNLKRLLLTRLADAIVSSV